MAAPENLFTILFLNNNNMDFETTNKPKSTETEKYSGAEKQDLLQPLKTEVKIECPERQEAVDQGISELNTAFQTLGIYNFQLPKIEIKFIKPESENKPELGKVGCVHEDGSVEIHYDIRFQDQVSGDALEKEIQRTCSYPGFKQSLKHELAHVSMWSITHLPRQAATRLIDEGFASLVEHTDTQLPTEQTKKQVKDGLANEPENYERCLDFVKPINGETENLNEAEYIVGRALLLWIRELKGNEKMIELIQKSPEKSRRNNDLPNDPEKYEQTLIDPQLHKLGLEYFSIISNIDMLTFDEVINKATNWEGRQFESALLEVTGLQNLNEVKQEFLKWINQ